MQNLVVVAFLAVTGVAFGQAKPDTSDKTEEGIQVFTQKITPESMYDPVVFGGWVRSRSSWSVTSPISGTVMSISTDLGEKVRQGKVLSKIKPLETGFGKASVRSPVSGVLTSKLRRVGETVKMGDVIAKIEAPDELEVMFQVSPHDRLQAEQDMQLFALWGERSVPLALTSVAPVVDPKTGLLTAYAVPTPKSDSMPMIGQWVRVELRQRLRQGIKVPIKHLRSNMSELLIMDPEGKAQWRKVRLGNFFGKEVEILDGIVAGETLVTSYAKRPKDGEELRTETETKVSTKAQSKPSPKG